MDVTRCLWVACAIVLGAAAPAAAQDSDDEAPPVSAGIGQGVVLRSEDGDYSLQIRGRVQTRFSARFPEDDEVDPSLAFQIRRARLVLRATMQPQDLELYLQLGIAPADMEPDLPSPVRDAYLTWSGARDVNLRVGQMKVPFNRERIASSAAMQFSDRSITNGELTLDRDVGVQVFSNDLFGLHGLLGYQLGVFGGEGRNRVGSDDGLLYVARVQISPFGPFDDAYSSADLLREDRPRLAFSAAAAYNHRAHRTRSTTGDFYELEGFDTTHFGADVIFKWAGLSVQAEALARETNRPLNQGVVDGESMTETGRSGYGFMAQAGYVFPFMVEVAGRYSVVEPMPGMETAIAEQTEITGAVNWYMLGHDLKLQTEYIYSYGAVDAHEARTQLQLFF